MRMTKHPDDTYGHNPAVGSGDVSPKVGTVGGSTRPLSGRLSLTRELRSFDARLERAHRRVDKVLADLKRS